MRKLPLLLVLFLLSVLVAAVPAQGSLLLAPVPTTPTLALAGEEEDEADEEPGEEDAGPEEEEPEEDCEFEEEELCEEEDTPKAKRKDDECLLKGARAAVTANPGKRRLRLTVHYRTWKPATVSVEASLQGPKGAVYLGADHARFRRSGVYRDTFGLAEKQMKKALAATEFTVELHVVNTPPSCTVELTGASRRARR
jgi:hypothetical protein